MKTEEEHFIDWEAHVFGYGYGTGEPHTLHVLKEFFDCLTDKNAYDYRTVEERLTTTVAWLLINTLCRANIFEYGTSPRYGWLTNRGLALKAFLDARTVAELVKLVCEHGDDYIVCYPDACNCGPTGYEKGKICPNPFWSK